MPPAGCRSVARGRRSVAERARPGLRIKASSSWHHSIRRPGKPIRRSVSCLARHRYRCAMNSRLAARARYRTRRPGRPAGSDRGAEFVCGDFAALIRCQPGDRTEALKPFRSDDLHFGSIRHFGADCDDHVRLVRETPPVGRQNITAKRVRAKALSLKSSQICPMGVMQAAEKPSIAARELKPQIAIDALFCFGNLALRTNGENAAAIYVSRPTGIALIVCDLRIFHRQRNANLKSR